MSFDSRSVRKAVCEVKKNDLINAEAIAEIVDRKNMPFVPIKTDDQLDLQAIHRVRDRLISRHTAAINHCGLPARTRHGACAKANKLARIMWAVLSNGNEYRSITVPA